MNDLKPILAILVDCGDTLVDESTEVKNAGGISLSAELIPGADQLLFALKQRQYPLALVADGPQDTFVNNLERHGLYSLFDGYAISGELGVEKPHPQIFQSALQQLGIPSHQYHKVIMLGNNLSRDIKGANELGIISVWLDWSPRRSKIPTDASETPAFTIHTPIELLDLLDHFEKDQLEKEKSCQ